MNMLPNQKFPYLRLFFFLSFMFVSACAGLDMPDQSLSSPAPWDPMPGDSSMKRGEIELIDVEIVPVESDPSRFNLLVSGALPTPCHLLRVDVSSPDKSSNIKVEIYSLVDPDQVCIQVLEPFSEKVPLGVFTEGKYQVIVNGTLMSELNP